MISIILPLHNSESFIALTISGILAQTHIDWELFLVDDGSTDASYDLARQYSAFDDRIQLIRLDRNFGAVIARNRALEVCSGRYIAFCDSDDIWMPDKLEKQLQAIQSSSHGICCTAYERIDGDGRKLGNLVVPPAVTDYNRLLRSNCIGMSTALIDTQVCGDVRLPDIKRRQDYALWLQLTRRGHTALGLEEPLVQYRVHPSSLSSNKLKSAYYHWKVLRDLEKLSLPSTMRYFARYCYDASRKRL